MSKFARGGKVSEPCNNGEIFKLHPVSLSRTALAAVTCFECNLRGIA